VYKVHHHGSRYSTNSTWLQTIHPRIGIVSTATGNTHNHPTEECIERLHNAGIKLFWTKSGNGIAPEDGFDTVRTTAPAATTTFNTWLSGGDLGGPTTTTSFVWSKNSNLYHVASCKTAQTISPANRQTGTTPPAGKTLHHDCPK
jgi:hypothetical protein